MPGQQQRNIVSSGSYMVFSLCALASFFGDDDDDDDDDDKRKNLKKTKFASNDRSGHDDQFCPKIVKIGAILAIFRPFEDFGNMPKINQNHSC